MSTQAIATAKEVFDLLRDDLNAIETELVRRHDRWTYEFKLLPATGRLYRVQVDAENGVLLIKGAVPGRTGGLVMVRGAIKRGEK